MEGKVRGKLSATVIVLIALAGSAWAEERTWTDATGKFNVHAEFVAVEGERVVLRKADGRQFRIALKRLSDADRTFISKLPASGDASDDEAIGKVVAEIAQRFYGDLRNRDRDLARQSLSKKAQSIIAAGQSTLTGLPEPAAGEKSIRPGKVKLEGQLAEIPVYVRSGGLMHKTKLHLREEGDQWVVFALSANYPDGEKSINFEAEMVPQQNIDPLQALVGKTFELEGFTLEGQPISISQYKDKVVLVDFWATWCGPCRAEIPNIAQNYQQYHADGFEVIAVSVDQDLNALATFVGEEKPPWTVVADNHPRNKKSMAGRYGIRGIPAFVLVGTDGKVAAIHCRGERLGQQLDRLLRNGG